MLDPGVLRASIEHAAATWGIDELVVAASLWNKQYNAAVVTAPLAAMTLCGIGLDASLGNASIVLNDGIPQALHVNDLAGLVVHPERFASTSPVGLRYDVRTVGKADELGGDLLPRVFTEHLEPVIEPVKQVCRLSRNVTWANAGNLCAYLYEIFAKQPGSESAALEDRAALLGAATPAVRGRNPMHGVVWYEEPSLADGPPLL